MRYFLLVSLCCFACLPARAQQSLTFVIRDAESLEFLPGATAGIKGTSIGAQADLNGRVILQDLEPGSYVLEFRFVGYKTNLLSIMIPASESYYEIMLVRAHEELEEVTIQSTRSSRTIANMPTRVEVVTAEELEEKSNMKPGDIRMLLSESTGIQVQQTSATSANASIRIQGLDGRYTQLLRDGLPLYAGLSSGLSLLQIPPLDLQQVEIIKGSSSTLYGGGAIAGIVNLISKTPNEEPELRFLLNGTSAGGTDISGYFGKRFEKTGLTLFTARNANRPYDPADIQLTAIPKFERYTLNPRFFYYPTDNTTLMVGVNSTWEDRLGGDIRYVRDNSNSTAQYFERNTSRRLSGQLIVDHKFGVCSHLTLKTTYNYFDRSIAIPEFQFAGTQQANFTEVSFARHGEVVEWIAGTTLNTDQFVQRDVIGQAHDYKIRTIGLFVQNTWNASEFISLESGLRADHITQHDVVLMPRISALFTWSPSLTSRIGGGYGYKVPLLFTEEAEQRQYRDIRPINQSTQRLETSTGLNADINYRTTLFDDQISFSINHLFFYTRIKNPLLLTAVDTDTDFAFINNASPIDTRGTETNVKIGYDDFKLFLGYTYTDARRYSHDDSYSVLPLTPRNRINAVLMYEIEDAWRIGLESYYFDRQRLSDNATGRRYWICGFMVEKIWEHLSVFINFENFLDARQTRFDTIYTGPLSSPVFRDIYAPVDGFVINGGIKLSL